MIEQVAKIVANALLQHLAIELPEVGVLVVERVGARQISRNKIAAPYFKIELKKSYDKDGVSLVEEIAETFGVSKTQAEEIYQRWRDRHTSESGLEIEGVGKIEYGNFIIEEKFATRLNPMRSKGVELRGKRKSKGAIWIYLLSSVAILVSVVALVMGYMPHIVSVETETTDNQFSIEKILPELDFSWGGESATDREIDSLKSLVATLQAENSALKEQRDTTLRTNATDDEITSEQVQSATKESETKRVETTTKSTSTKEAQPTKESLSTKEREPKSQPNNERLVEGWSYVMYGVYSTQNSAQSAYDRLIKQYPEYKTTARVHPFGNKYMISLSEWSDRDKALEQQRSHRKRFEELWVYTK